MDVLREEVGVEAELVRGHGGVFEVAVDGKIVARKTWTGFPSEAEIVNAVSREVEARPTG